MLRKESVRYHADAVWRANGDADQLDRSDSSCSSSVCISSSNCVGKSDEHDDESDDDESDDDESDDDESDDAAFHGLAAVA